MIVNDVTHDIASPRSLVDLLNDMGGAPRGIAVAIIGEIVRRSQWEKTEVQPSDKMEIATAVAGG